MIDRGLFISFEGPDGCGKTTQMLLLVESLRKRGFRVVENREPGGTRIGGKIRSILLDPAHQEMTAMTELLLMFASRAQAAREIILPALDRGEIVISDRFTDSSLAYQGAGRSLGNETVRTMHRLALGSLNPDLTLLIDIDPETALARARHRSQAKSEARLELQSLEFHRRVSKAYRDIAASEPDRIRIIDGIGARHTVAERVWSEVSPMLARVAPAQVCQ